jgi:hypothetical protein
VIYLIIAGLVFAFSLVAWNLVHFAPRSVSMFLPDRVSVVLGLVLLPLGIFSAFTAAFAQQNAEGMIASIVIAYVGLWFLLIKFAGSGATEMQEMIRRLFAMMGMLMAVLLATLYLGGDSRLIGVFNLLLMCGGLWLTTGYLRYLDRGR